MEQTASSFKAPNSEDVVRVRLARMELLRETVAQVNPATMVVMTIAEVLDEAVAYYRGQGLELDFVLLDGDANQADAAAKKHHARVFLLKDEKSRAGRKLCLYARPDREYWKPNCLIPLAHICHKLGLKNYLLDPAMGKALWQRGPVPDFVHSRLADIAKVYEALADEESKDVFLRAMKALETGDAGYLPFSFYPQYEHPLVKAQEGDVVYEGGIHHGSTTITFAKKVGRSGRVYGFEPVKEFWQIAKNNTQHFPQVTMENLGLWSARSTFYIENNGGGSRMVNRPNKKTEECHSVDLTSYLAEKKELCDLIKLDIEGAEEECLKGSMPVIRHYQPKLMISLYHKPEHYLDIPLMLMKENLGYTFYMGHHNSWFSETCLYALPQAQLNRKSKEIRPGVVSIIIPAHNCENTIERAIDSVIIQALEGMEGKLEIVVVDDCSTDNTPNLIAKYLSLCPDMLRALRLHENKGAGEARNVGLELATGEYVVFLDSDDMLAEGFLAQAVAEMEKSGAEVLVGERVDASKPLDLQYLPLAPWSGAGIEATRCFLGGDWGHRSLAGMIFRRLALERERLFFSRAAQPALLFGVQALALAKKVNITAITACYCYPHTTPPLDGIALWQGLVDFAYELMAFCQTYQLEEAGKVCLGDVYAHERGALLRGLNGAAPQGTREMLSSVLLDRLSRISWLTDILLKDAALLHCRVNGLRPKVASGHGDWREDAARLAPDEVWKAYGRADEPGLSPLISVVIPNYNKAQWLPSCLKSVLEQNVDFELIVIDDASTDGSFELLKDYADMNPQVRLYSMAENCRQGVGRNLGMDLARGKYLVFMDSDDLMEPDFLRHGAELMEKEGVDMAVFASRLLDERDKCVYSPTPDYGGPGGHEAVLAYIAGKITPEPWAKMFRTVFLKEKKLRFPNMVYHQDHPFVVAALEKAKNIAASPFCAYKARRTPDSSVRPAAFRHLHIRSACQFYAFLNKIAEQYDDGAVAKIESHAVWNVQNIFLPALAAFMEQNKVPLSSADRQCLQGNLMWRPLLMLFAKEYCTHPAWHGVLRPLPWEKTQSYSLPACPQPIVSVIIPVFNQETRFSYCLNSLFTQSLHKIEILVIDDASTDRSCDVCLAHMAKDGRISLIPNEKNKGQGLCRNQGVAEAKGQFISFVDSDDKVLPDFMLHALGQLTMQPDVDIVHFSYRRENLQGEVIKEERDADALMTGEECLEAYCTGKIKAWAVWSKLFRTDFLEKYDLDFPEYMFEDNLFLTKAYHKAKYVQFIHSYGYINVITPHIASTINALNHTGKHVSGVVNLASDIIEYLNKNIDASLLNIILPSRMRSCFNRYLILSDYVIHHQPQHIGSMPRSCMQALEKTPYFFRMLLEDFASRYFFGKKVAGILHIATESFENNITLAHQGNIKMPWLTIIIPVFNTSKSLGRCLDSILCQDHEGVEIIVIDDASTDASFMIGVEYAKKNHCISLYRAKNNYGQGPLRNFAINIGKGTCITFVDSDDIVTQSFLPLMQRFLRKNIDGGVFSYARRTEDGDNLFIHTSQTLSGAQAFEAFRNSSIKHWMLCGTVWTRDFLHSQHIVFTPWLFEDTMFLCNALQKANSVEYYSDVAYVYDVRFPSSAMRSITYSWRGFAGAAETLIALNEFLYDSGCREPALRLTFLQEKWHNARFADQFLGYVEFCRTNKLESPLTDELLLRLIKVEEVRDLLLIEHATLVQQQRQASAKAQSTQVHAPNKPAVANVKPAVAQSKMTLSSIKLPLRPEAIPQPGPGPLWERLLWRISPKRACALALRRCEAIDVEWYARRYPDVAAAKIDPATHYVYHGAVEGRDPTPWFNSGYYVRNNPDVAASGQNPFYHYLRYGREENRACRG